MGTYARYEMYELLQNNHVRAFSWCLKTTMKMTLPLCEFLILFSCVRTVVAVQTVSSTMSVCH